MLDAPGFWESWEIWYEAVIMALVSAGALAYLGVWVSIKKVTWVPLALTQVSALGVVVAFLLHELMGLHSGEDEGLLLLFEPAWFSFLVAVLVAVYFGHPRVGGRRGVVVAYLLASAGVLIVGSFVRQDIHDVKTILFGQTVLAEMSQVWLVMAAGALVVLVHFFFYRRFLFVSFDPAAAGASGLSVFGHEVLLYATVAVMLSATTRAMGALPAFGLCILPALAGLQVCCSMPRAFLLAITCGLFSALGGYYLSFTLSIQYEVELSTGACMVAIAGILMAISWAVVSLRRG